MVEHSPKILASEEKATTAIISIIFTLIVKTRSDSERKEV